MRKYIRAIMRASAEKHGYKPSKAVHAMWTRYQISKHGKNGPRIRAANQAKGTHKLKNWRSRIASAV